MMKIGVVYEARSPSGKVYIGKTMDSLASRKRRHLHTANYPEKNGGDTKFRAALRKYGSRMEWTILHRSKSKKHLAALEIREIQRHDSFVNGYNSTLGGDGGCGVQRAPARRTAFKARMTGTANPFFGKHHAHATRLKWSEKRKGNRRSVRSRLKQAATVSGVGNPMFGRHHTEFCKRSMNKSHIKSFCVTSPEKCRIILHGLEEINAFAQRYVGCSGKYFYNRRTVKGFKLCALP
jgi:group I intron endonuclease